MQAMSDARRQRWNVTRRNRSIPRRLLREGALHLIPLYYLLRLSDLGREAIEHSGSFRFADHIYRGTPSGRTPLGRWIDRRLLEMPAARAFRQRYEQSKRVMRLALESTRSEAAPVRVLAVPCGLPRDVVDLASAMGRENRRLLSRLEYHGFDIDYRALAQASRLTAECGLGSAHYHLGDALDRCDYPRLTFHLVVSTGLGEFLSDEQLMRFYRHVYDVMERGAMFYTSATARDPRSDALLQLAELSAIYRPPNEVERLFAGLPWTHVDIFQDPTGLQTFVTAIK
jgi:hypothetical protein